MATLAKSIATLLIALLPLGFFPPKPKAPPSDTTGPYKVGPTFHVGGSGRWDYITIDPVSKLLYVPRTTHTMVISADDGKSVADIPGQKSNHGVAIVASAGRGFISDGGAGAVIVFDTKTNKELGKIKADKDADAIFYDAGTNKVFVGCGDAEVLIPISPDVDPVSGKADPAIKLGGKPESFAMDGKGKAFVALENKSQIAVVDIKAGKVLSKWPTSPGGDPVGVAIDRDHGRLYVGCRKPQKLVVMDTADGKVLADLPIGSGCDSARFDNGYAFASCRDGTLAIAKETSSGHFEIVENLTTQEGAKTVDVDPMTHKLYLPTAEFAKGGIGRPTPKPDTFMIVVVEPSGG